jgi:hypothetical protein
MYVELVSITECAMFREHFTLGQRNKFNVHRTTANGHLTTQTKLSANAAEHFVRSNPEGHSDNDSIPFSGVFVWRAWRRNVTDNLHSAFMRSF